MTWKNLRVLKLWHCLLSSQDLVLVYWQVNLQINLPYIFFKVSTFSLSIARSPRVVHESLFLDPTRPGKTLTRPRDYQQKVWPDPTPDPICTIFQEFNVTKRSRVVLFILWSRSRQHCKYQILVKCIYIFRVLWAMPPSARPDQPWPLNQEAEPWDAPLKS